MRASFVPENPRPVPPAPPDIPADSSPEALARADAYPAFLPFCREAFSQARARNVPVFLYIGEAGPELCDPALAALIRERTVPVQLLPGMRPDVELLCQQAGALFSQEGALPLCALLLPDALPYLAAPLPPAGFPMDASRLYVWLSQADRRFSQNYPALVGQAMRVAQSLRAPNLTKPYSPRDAAHDLTRALEAAEDRQNGGFGRVKSPMPAALLFLQHASARGERSCRAALNRCVDAMLASPAYDPLDGLFFRATLTEDWRVFVPEKPLAVNALLALLLLECGRRSEAVRALDSMLSAFSLQGGGFAPSVCAPRGIYAFTPEQVCAALGAEDGLRACRLLSLLRRDANPDPEVTPSRFSPVPEDGAARGFGDDAPLFPRLPRETTPEDEAFLRGALKKLRRARAARASQRPSPYLITEDCALAAYVFAVCGRRLGESRYTQAAQRAVSRLAGLTPAAGALTPLPPSFTPSGALYAQKTCGAAAALSLALLFLGQEEDMRAYAQSGLQLLGSALHAFLSREGLVLHTPEDPAAFFPRVPALMDGELPSPAALLVRALLLADALRPEAHYRNTIEDIWRAAAPLAHAAPLSAAGIIDAANL